AAEQYNDYRAANTLMVGTATARLPDEPEPTDEKAPLPHALPLQTHRVEQVKVTFTPVSEETVKKELGHAAEGSIGRVRQALQASLQFDATAAPQKKLHDGVAGDLKGGYDAYLQTPLVFGSIHLTFNLISIAIVTIITIVLILGIKESANFNAIMVLVK